MSESTNSFQIKDNSANPAPLGLFGFGMTTVLLNLANAGIIEVSGMILAMGICYGSIAQILAGIMEWKKNNTFGTTAFISYGFFWLSFVIIVLTPKIDPDMKASLHSIGWYLIMWGIFTFGMFIATFRLSCALQVVFGSLTLLFFLLASEHFCDVGVGVKHLIGYEGIFCGLSAMYTGIALILNEVYARTVLPLGVCSRK